MEAKSQDIKETKMQDPQDYITAIEISKRLGIGVGSVYDLLRSDGFPAVPYGARSYIVPRLAFMAWISDPKNIIEYKRCVRKDVSGK